MNKMKRIVVDGVLYTVKTITAKVPQLSRQAAQSRMIRYLKRKDAAEKMFAPIAHCRAKKRVIKSKMEKMIRQSKKELINKKRLETRSKLEKFVEVTANDSKFYENYEEKLDKRRSFLLVNI